MLVDDRLDQALRSLIRRRLVGTLSFHFLCHAEELHCHSHATKCKYVDNYACGVLKKSETIVSPDADCWKRVDQNEQARRRIAILYRSVIGKPVIRRTNNNANLSRVILSTAPGALDLLHATLICLPAKCAMGWLARA